jgi:hypothetical protein
VPRDHFYQHKTILPTNSTKHIPFWEASKSSGQSQWPRGLKRGSIVARLLRMWVRIPRVYVCLSVASVVCCQVDVSAASWSLVQRSPTDCGASFCDN